MDTRTESDIERLRQLTLLLEAEVERLLKVIAKLSKQLEKATGKPGQLEIALKTLESLKERAKDVAKEKAEIAKRVPKKRTSYGPTEQPQLKQSTIVGVLDEADQVCPECGDPLKAWGERAEHSELIDVIAIEYKLVKVERQKYRCDCCGHIETALPPTEISRFQDGGRYSTGFVAQVIVDKYVDHIPLSRDVRRMKRSGLNVTSQTLWDQCNAAARRLQATYYAILAYILAQPVIGLDQTGWKNLSSRKAKLWQMWGLTAANAVYYCIRDDKSANTFIDLVGDFEGVIVCDALASHGAGARGSPGVTLAGCWAHVFRKFREAAPDFPDAEIAMAQISTLYEIDYSATSDEERAELRRTKSKEELAELHAWLSNYPALQSTSLGGAIRYTLGQWEPLTQFVTNAAVPLDNNWIERAFRGPVLGRRNHFGSKSARGTEVAAILYTLVETAKLAGEEPSAYLRRALDATREAPELVVLPGTLGSS